MEKAVGFARLAIESGYPIVPFAAVGAEEMFRVLLDSHTQIAAQVCAHAPAGRPSAAPISRGLGPTLLPRPERLYFWFGAPLETGKFGGAGEDDVGARAVRDQVKAAVEEGIQTLLAELATTEPDAWLVTRAFEAWNEHGAAGAAAWMSPWVQLTDPPEWPGATTWVGRGRTLARLDEMATRLGATSAEVVDARTIGADVLVVFRLCKRPGSATDPSGLVALFGVEQEQIMRMRVFMDREAALATADEGSRQLA